MYHRSGTSQRHCNDTRKENKQTLNNAKIYAKYTELIRIKKRWRKNVWQYYFICTRAAISMHHRYEAYLAKAERTKCQVNCSNGSGENVKTIPLPLEQKINNNWCSQNNNNKDEHRDRPVKQTSNIRWTWIWALREISTKPTRYLGPESVCHELLVFSLFLSLYNIFNT